MSNVLCKTGRDVIVNKWSVICGIAPRGGLAPPGIWQRARKMGDVTLADVTHSTVIRGRVNTRRCCPLRYCFPHTDGCSSSVSVSLFPPVCHSASSEPSADLRNTRGRNILSDPPRSPIEITGRVGFLNNSECIPEFGRERVHARPHRCCAGDGCWLRTTQD